MGIVSTAMRRRFTALVVLAGSAVAFAQVPSPAERPLALLGGTLYLNPTDAPVRNGAVIMHGGRITAAGPRASVQVPAGAEVIDASGHTIAAGFWNSHVHFMQRKWRDAAKVPAAELAAQMQAMLTRYGFTSVFDTGSAWENTRRLRDRIESGEIAGPAIRSTGEILFPKGGVPPDLFFDTLRLMRMKSPEVADDTDAATAARALLDAGADGIKVYAVTWIPPIAALPESAIRAVADEAHRRGKLLFAHPSNREGLLAAVRGGADVLVHTAPDGGAWDGEVVATMKKAGITLIPTLKLWHYELRHDRDSQREAFAALAVAQLRAWRAAGGTTLFGTDVGYMADYDPADEYTLMARAGMSPAEILASLTTAPATRFGEAKARGRIATGLAADLVVLSGDPVRSVRAFAAVRYTIRRGKVIYRAG
jgi:imidazolonepropionase-like amidohydrolase